MTHHTPHELHSLYINLGVIVQHKESLRLCYMMPQNLEILVGGELFQITASKWLFFSLSFFFKYTLNLQHFLKQYRIFKLVHNQIIML
jgi:hypothetical protein